MAAGAPYLSGCYVVPAGGGGREEASHWRLTRSVLADPSRFWKSLREERD